MRRLQLLSFAALIGLSAVACVHDARAQTAGGPAAASPGAMPSQTPLTSSGAPRATAAPAAAPAPAATPAPSAPVTTGAATPATPGATGASKPARPTRATVHHTRRTKRRVTRAPASTSDQGDSTSQ